MHLIHFRHMLHFINFIHFIHFIHVIHHSHEENKKARRRKRENGKGRSQDLCSNSTGQPVRAYARTKETKRNDFPVELTAQPPCVGMLEVMVQ